MSANKSQIPTLASIQGGDASLSIFTRTKPRQVVIDPDGELHLAVGSLNGVTFIVCPKTLARASLFWKTLLYGGFAESIQPDRSLGSEWIVKLPADHPKAMEIFLNIIHSCFDKIPTAVRFCSQVRSTSILHYKDLYQLTVLTDKYDLTRILRPWAQNWVKDIDWNFSEYTASAMEFLSWITWELGDKKTFIQVARHIILGSITGPKGVLRLDYRASKQLFTCGLEPTGLYGLISDKRLQVIREMLKPVKAVVTRLLKGDIRNSTIVCTSAKDRTTCDLTMLGAIVRSLTQADLYPIPKPEGIHISVVQLADKLRSIDCRSRLHKCNALPDITTTINRILQSVGPELTETHIQHLKAQAEKTGLES
ncbi:hypothetical protein M434DRAFT_28111 [Hypoxylon sp. CO27-5]|nr:hypothetical protein M434DRAFT_28111 [Hypoxylon sp. CO27-5]